MTHATHSQPSPSRCATTINTKMQVKSQEEMTSRPCFAFRMIRTIFKRRHRSACDQQAKSWPGCAEPVSMPESTVSRSQPSATIAIPSTVASSAPSKVPTAYTKPQRAQMRSVNGYTSEASWRQRQTHCANCERLFFKSMSTLSNTAGRFCSLDCKANFEYLAQLQMTMNVEMLGTCVASSGLFDEIECEDDAKQF